MKKTGLFTLMATAIVGAVIAKNSTLLASSPIASEATNATEVYNSPALASEGETEIIGSDCVNISYPTFYRDLFQLAK